MEGQLDKRAVEPSGQREVAEQMESPAVGPGGQREVVEQLEDPALGPAGQREVAEQLENPAVGPRGQRDGVEETECLAVGPGGQREVVEQMESLAVELGGQREDLAVEQAGQREVVEQVENPALGPDGQQELVEEMECLAVEPAGQREVVEQLEKPAVEPGEQREVVEKPAVEPGGQRAAEPEMVQSPAEGSGGAQAPLPAAVGPRRSPPPAWPRSPAAAVLSSDSDSDSDSDSSSSTLFSSSSSSSSAVSDEDYHPNEKDNRSYCIRTKDELPIDKLPPVEDLSIVLPDNVELKLFGTVSSVIEQLVIIESLKGLPPVNEESIIFKEDRQAVGKIFEVFGPVSHPFYVIRFNSSEHIKEKGINVQDSMYFAPSVEDFTQYIFAEKLKQEKGSDASWKNDQEPPPEVLDFSDDEQEREAKQKKKKPQSQGRKKVRSETFPPSENKELHHSVKQPASRGYRGRGFSRDLFAPPSGPRGFFRPQVRPPPLYFSDWRMHQEPQVFPPPHGRENPTMQQYGFPPPDFGYVSDWHQFPPPPSNMNMMWTGPNAYNSSYSFLPPPPPPPPPPPAPDSHPPQFRP
uniref:H/ACA ribonucleoprotein complex non-core subunit NAF1 n=1 Tax=Zonotrichia albicollis TaxID=44394 RepID=A0A8D2MM83_ZONAL|nr:H/ACA ribonucleoprotein complex non-core subunit NAF1 [Zonotrichia albicollis]